MRIAIIGSGISGLVAARQLHAAHELTVYEANEYAGGHTNTVSVSVAGEYHAVDTGFIVFNDRTYPNFCRLLQELRVESLPTSMSFSVRADEDNLEYSGSGLAGLFVQKRNLLRPRFYWMARNTRSGSRRNIGAHYDLGNEFFELFLDPGMMYSSAIFDDTDMSLADAQTARLDETCRRLQLKASDHLLEIGTGWGGFALHAAKNFGCRVTTTTISENQFRYAQQRVAEAGLSDRVTVLQRDYRDLTGTYDKLVSLEMIEAVGPQFYDQYFSKCARLLDPNGRMLLQAIVMPEQRYSRYLKSVDFIQKYIFPGGCLPSVTAMQNSMTRNSSLRLLSMDDFAEGYAGTLREWRRRFLERQEDVRQLGYSERFIRMWDYYLTYCEGAFEERAVGVVQAVWGR